MENAVLVEQINKDMAIALPDEISLDELQLRLSAHINRLIQTGFQQ